MKVKKETLFPKTKIQWLWENMKGRRVLYVIGMLGTVVYNILQLTVPYYSGRIVDLFLSAACAPQHKCRVDVTCFLDHSIISHTSSQ